MPVTINDYTATSNGASSDTWTSADANPAIVTVGGTKQGLIIIGGWADDPRLAGRHTHALGDITSTEKVTQSYRVKQWSDVSPPIPVIETQDGTVQIVSHTDTAVPYSLNKFVGLDIDTRTSTELIQEGQRPDNIHRRGPWFANRAKKHDPEGGYFDSYRWVNVQKIYRKTKTASATAVSLVFPAILARVVIAVPSEDNASFEFNGTSYRDDGSYAMKQLKAQSYDANTNLDSNETISKFTYTIAPSQPRIRSFNGETNVEMDVEKDDLVVFAASDTSANDKTISVTRDSGPTLQTLFDELYKDSLSNDDSETYTIGCLLRVDRAKSTGTLKATFTDVTGGVQAIRLTPVVEDKDDPASGGGSDYVALPADEDLAFFEVHLPVMRGERPIYPDWMERLLEFQTDSSGLGMIDNWPREVTKAGSEGVPDEYRQIQIWGIDKNFLNFTNIPSGEALVFETRQDMENRRQRLNEQM